MFQKNLKYKDTDYFHKFAQELRGSFLMDPEFEKYIRSRRPKGSDPTAEITAQERGQALYALQNSVPESEQSLRDSIGNLIIMLNKLKDMTDSMHPRKAEDPEPVKEPVYSLAAGSAWGQAVAALNHLNGYDKAKFLTNVEKDVTEVTGPTLLESVHGYLGGNKDYADIQKGPVAGVLLRFGQLASDAMMKMANFERKVQMNNLTREMANTEKGIDREAEKFFSGLTPEQKKTLRMSDEEYDAEMQKLTEEQNRYSEVEQNLAPAKNKEEIPAQNHKLYLQMRNGEATKGWIKEKEDIFITEITQEVHKTHEKAFRQELDKAVETTRAMEESRRLNEQEMYNDTKRANDAHEKENLKIDEHIRAAEKKLQEDLAALPTEGKEDVDRRMRAEFREKHPGWNKSVSTLQEEVNGLMEKIERMGKAAADKDFVERPETRLPQEHVNRRKKAETDVVELTRLSEQLYLLAGNERYAPAVDDALASKDLKKITAAWEDIEKAREKYQKARTNQAKYVNDTKKLEKAGKEVEKTKKELDAKERTFLDWGTSGAIISVLKTFEKNRPEVYAEFVKELNKDKTVNATTCLNHVITSYQNRITEIKKEFPDIYQKIENASRNNGGHNTQADMQQVKKSIEDINNQIETIYSFDREVKQRIEKVPTKAQLEEQRKALQKNADETIRELKGHKKALVELPKVRTKEDVEKAVAEKKAEIEKAQTIQIEAEIRVEAKKKTPELEAKVLGDYRLMIKGKINHIKEQLTDKKATRERAKDLHGLYGRGYMKAIEAQFKWERINGKASMGEEALHNSYLDLLESRMDKMTVEIHQGTKAGHSNTDEFKAMETSLKDVKKFLTEHKADLKAMKPDVMEQFKKAMDTMRDKAESYIAEKKKGIHVISSNMRYVRLQFADSLIKFADTEKQNLADMVAVEQTQKDVIGRLLRNQTAPKDPGKFNEFVENGIKSGELKQEKQLQEPKAKLQNPQEKVETKLQHEPPKIKAPQINMP